MTCNPQIRIVNTRARIANPPAGEKVLLTDIAWVQHEYGHYLQYLAHGPKYYAIVAAQSVGSMATINLGLREIDDHKNIFVEQHANTLAHKFLGPNSKLNTPDNPILPEWQINFGIIDFFKNINKTFWDGIRDIQNWRPH